MSPAAERSIVDLDRLGVLRTEMQVSRRQHKLIINVFTSCNIGLGLKKLGTQYSCPLSNGHQGTTIKRTRC
jgi:hypothetical protein